MNDLRLTATESKLAVEGPEQKPYFRPESAFRMLNCYVILDPWPILVPVPEETQVTHLVFGTKSRPSQRPFSKKKGCLVYAYMSNIKRAPKSKVTLRNMQNIESESESPSLSYGERRMGARAREGGGRGGG
jgi:hypothetical protein